MIPVWMNKISETEIAFMDDSIRNMHIMEGPRLREFEERLKGILETKYVIGTASGTAALALALLGIGIKPGDEVVVPDMTFIATANAPAVLGAKVIAAPVEKNRPILDINMIDEYITDRTKAIITVDLNGRISWSKELKDRYNKRGIKIIDDACQAFLSGGDGELCGTQADIGCFSFGITKTVSTINGGAVVTNDKELYDKMKIIKTQGMKSVFDGDKYFMPGFNFKLPDVFASVGIKQLDRIEGKKRRMTEIDKLYREGLAGIDSINFFETNQNEFSWMTDVVSENRDILIDALREKEIIARPAAPPLHTAEYISEEGCYETTDFFSKNLMFLPCGPDQPLENVEVVIETIRKMRF